MSDNQDIAVYRDKKLERRKIEEVGVAMRVRGFSFTEIAQVLLDKHQITVTPAKIRKLTDRAVGRTPISNANVLRSLENMRLQLMVKAMTEYVDWEKELAGEDEDPPTFSDKLRACIMLHKVSERFSSLNGINLQQTTQSINQERAEQDADGLRAVFAELRAEANEPDPDVIDVEFRESPRSA